MQNLDKDKLPKALPRIAITMGDPAGIGPEVIVKGWLRGYLHSICVPVVVGSIELLKKAVLERGADLKLIPLKSLERIPEFENDQIGVIEPLKAPDVASIVPGKIDARCGMAAYEYLNFAIDAALSSQIDAIVTLGLHKESLSRAGVAEPGHTEILARRCGVPDVAMMLYLPPEHGRHKGLGVVHATLHNSLRKVFDLLTPERLDASIRLAHDVMKPLIADGQLQPRVALAALNPHAGEGGLFGDEEIRLIAPAVARAQLSGMDASGPFSADTLFGQALGGQYDVVVAMYHDQGHVALKTLGFDRAVNITCGLPIVRTSVAHGTAFDIVGQGVARPESLESATYAAAKIALWHRRNHTGP